MQIIVGILSCVCIFYFVQGLCAILAKQSEEETNLVALPRSTAIVGVVCGLAFLIPVAIILFSQDEKNYGVALGFVAFSLLGVVLVIAHKNCRITYSEDDFTYKTFIGTERTVRYEELTAIQGKEKDIKLFWGKRVIRVDAIAKGSREFISHLKKQYRKAHDGEALPKVDKKDLFNNHVENPEEFIVIYCILAVVFTAMPIFLSISMVPHPREYFEEKIVIVDNYECSEDDLMLYDSEGNCYEIRSYTKVIDDTQELFYVLDGRPQLSLLVHYNGKADEPYYLVAGAKGKAEYLTFERWTDRQWKDYFLTIAIMWGMCCLMFIFMGFSIYVGRNPHKFSDKVLHLFFKPGYIHRD